MTPNSQDMADVMTDVRRSSVIMGEAEAASLVKDGMIVALGGYLSTSHPMAITRQIIRNGIKNLTVVGSQIGGLDLDLLIGAGCVRKIIAPCVTGEELAPIGPFFRWAAEQGKIDVWECDEGIYSSGLRAAGQMLPFAPWRGGVGTSYPQINPDIKTFSDPINGEPLLAVPAIRPDLFLTHAALADRYGNIQHFGTGFADKALARASCATIVQVEKIISNDEVRRNPAATTIASASGVVHAPFGSHPFSSPGFYQKDLRHLEEYLSAANRLVRHDDPAPFRGYLESHVYRPSCHIDYLGEIGLRHLFSLLETER